MRVTKRRAFAALGAAGALVAGAFIGYNRSGISGSWAGDTYRGDVSDKPTVPAAFGVHVSTEQASASPADQPTDPDGDGTQSV